MITNVFTSPPPLVQHLDAAEDLRAGEVAAVALVGRDLPMKTPCGIDLPMKTPWGYPAPL